ncbi:MAG TPA: DUF6527 family protein [Allosphingosinicella sp.]|jgi:hypothetical protein
MACPDACGSVLTINLDDRAGAAWRIYRERDLLSVYPSIWRESGCRAHFFLRRNRIIWCGPDILDVGEYDLELLDLVRAALDERHRFAEEIARDLEEAPWEVADAANELVNRGEAEKRRDGDRWAYSRSSTLHEQGRKREGRIGRLMEWLRRRWTGK